ncbi:unnamed protein product [Nezara viridula]|uniref:ATP synthase-coupling factor 6, mitochondrial n=1 Tax=Nezara viridula TaxID=85310 RepID=A0A9P0EEK0_NEZVI|nr:unnamed protein product [Nezara viridula]
MMNYLFQKNSNRLFYNSSVLRIEAVDPVQALFLKYVREYFQKLKQNNGVIFDVSPELEKDRAFKQKTLAERYFGNMDPKLFEKFPEMKYEEPTLDDINISRAHPLMKKS